MSAPNGPLRGIRVFDWTIFGVGPFASTMLGALGADVIKIEAPDGDPQLTDPSRQHGMSTMYINQNLCKRSIMLDLQSEVGQEQALKLLSTCDVFLNNMRPGTAERLGLAYEKVRAVSPRIVYCLVSGWGDTGPLASVGGVDILAQAFCGIVGITGQRDGPPEFYRQLGYLDYTASSTVAAAILEALYARDETGCGCELELSLFEAAVAVQSSRFSEYFATGRPIQRLGSASASHVPDEAFRTADGRYLAICVESDSQWQRLCASVDREDLAEREDLRTNSGRVAHRDKVSTEFARIFESMHSEWWKIQLKRYGVPHASFCDFSEMSNHPQVTQNRFLVKVPTPFGKIFSGSPPWSFSRERVSLFSTPQPGGDTELVLGSADESPPDATARICGCSPPEERARQPLQRLRVLDLTSGIAGPYCGQLLVSGGAQVVKLEPSAGDHVQEWEPRVSDSFSSVYVSLNCDKAVWRAKNDQEYRKLCRAWATEADVVLTDLVDVNGRGPAVTYADARSNQRLVYCSLSTFGERGPLRRLPGSELTCQALAAVSCGLGRSGEPPLRIGADVASINAGFHAFQAIMAALIARARTGQGQRVAVSVLGSLLFLKSSHWGAFSDPDSWGVANIHRSWTREPNHGYRTKDGRLMFVWYRGDQSSFRSLLEEIGIGERVRSDARFQETPWWTSMFGPYGDEAVELYETGFATRTTEELIALLGRHGAYAVPILEYPRLVQHPQFQAQQLLDNVAIDASVLNVLRRPWRTKGIVPLAARTAPYVKRLANNASVPDDPWCI